MNAMVAQDIERGMTEGERDARTRSLVAQRPRPLSMEEEELRHLR